MKFKNRPLWQILTLSFMGMLLVAMAFLYGLLAYQQTKYVEKKEEDILFSLGEHLAIEEDVIQTLVEKKFSPEIETYTNQLMKIYDLDFIVLMDLDGIRYTHPDESKIGHHFEGGDEKESLKGKKTISVSSGSLGQSLRGFVPVFKGEKQVGAVAIGITLNSLTAVENQAKKSFPFMFIFAVILAFFFALFVSYHLKKQLKNLEPKGIVRLLEERDAMLNETKDAVFVINHQHEILLANRQGTELFSHLTREHDVVGKSIDELITSETPLDFHKKEEQIFKQVGEDFLVSVAPIIVEKEEIGHILFFRNATELSIVMMQLENTTAYAKDLQTQSHEFLNKLHVIYGLVDLKAYDELKIYLNELLLPEEIFHETITYLIENPMLSSFFLGQRQKFLEKKVQFSLTIENEIPKTSPEQSLKLIKLLRYFHINLLKEINLEKIAINLKYTKDQLEFQYEFSFENNDSSPFSYLEEDYFKRQLEKNRGEIVVEKGSSPVFLFLQLYYEKEWE